MAHEIDMSNNRANMAYIGEAPWHGLGQELTPGASIDEWRKQAGMDWHVETSPVLYNTPDSRQYEYHNQKVLYRSDTYAPLSIVGKEYNIVQPAEVIEFFRDLTEQHGMVLTTAGCLFGGQRFWALADTGRETEISKGDTVKGFLLFVTSVDGTLSSSAKFVCTRVVCNNTLSVAMKEKNRVMVRKTHRSDWDSTQVKLDLGLLNSSWGNFMLDLRRLSDRKMSDAEVSAFFKKTFFDPKLEDVSQPLGARKRVANLTDLYVNGAGAELSYGTAFGALNAVTNLFTHGTGRHRVMDRKFWNAYFDNAAIKNSVMEDLLELC